MSETEEKNRVQGEGKDLRTAIGQAAEQLGVPPEDVGYEVDLSHFRSATGGMVPQTTVRIIGWVEEGAGRKVAATPQRERKEPRPPAEDSRPERRSEGRERKERREKKEPRRAPARSEAPEADDATVEAAAAFAGAWFEKLMDHMDIEGTVTASARGGRVHLDVQAERAGRVIGKRGSTLRAVRHLLRLSVLEHHGDLTLDIDVEDPRRPKDEGAKRGERPRKSGGGGGGRGRGERRSKGGSAEYSEEKLNALARRAAEKAVETGKTITINLELSSYDRRLVHVAISEVDGVRSESEVRDGVKYVQVIPE